MRFLSALDCLWTGEGSRDGVFAPFTPFLPVHSPTACVTQTSVAQQLDERTGSEQWGVARPAVPVGQLPSFGNRKKREGLEDQRGGRAKSLLKKEIMEKQAVQKGRALKSGEFSLELALSRQFQSP